MAARGSVRRRIDGQDISTEEMRSISAKTIIVGDADGVKRDGGDEEATSWECCRR
jgi:hypothetical protein